jgi:ceramide glucosyltransferase
MLQHTVKFIQIIAVLGTFSSIGYYLMCLLSAARFLQEKKTLGTDDGPPETFPPVSILKPLKGTDPEMYESLRSHCLQDYPVYEILFGIKDTNDPAAEIVERLKAEFPQRLIRLVVCPENLGANTKVSNLAQMLPVARYEFLIVNDSDIRVEPDYLRRVIAPLADPKVGMVTCLYRGVPEHTLGSRLESLGISTDFSAGVLVARQVEGGIRFGLGSTLAFRRHDLQAIGGFQSFVEYLADDYEIGRRITERGLEVKLSETVVETFVPPYSVREFFLHQLRWARSVRDSRPWGYLGLGLTFGLAWSLLTLALDHGATWAWTLLAATLAMRMMVAIVVGRLVLRDRHVLRLLGLITLRDLVAVLLWIASFTGHTVAWRGVAFRLKDGKLARITP